MGRTTLVDLSCLAPLRVRHGAGFRDDALSGLGSKPAPKGISPGGPTTKGETVLNTEATNNIENDTSLQAAEIAAQNDLFRKALIDPNAAIEMHSNGHSGSGFRHARRVR